MGLATQRIFFISVNIKFVFYVMMDHQKHFLQPPRLLVGRQQEEPILDYLSKFVKKKPPAHAGLRKRLLSSPLIFQCIFVFHDNKLLMNGGFKK